VGLCVYFKRRYTKGGGPAETAAKLNVILWALMVVVVVVVVVVVADW
jgi:hypothetical protein